MKKIEVTKEEQARLDECTKFIRRHVRGTFKPCAVFTPEMNDFRVIRKDCSYTAKFVTRWADIHVDSHCPWYLPWKKYTGFTLYCPPSLGFRGEALVTAILDRVLQEDPGAFAQHRARFYRLARGLSVHVSYEVRE